MLPRARTWVQAPGPPPAGGSFTGGGAVLCVFLPAQFLLDAHGQPELRGLASGAPGVREGRLAVSTEAQVQTVGSPNPSCTGRGRRLSSSPCSRSTPGVLATPPFFLTTGTPILTHRGENNFLNTTGEEQGVRPGSGPPPPPPPGSLQDPPVQRGWMGRRQSASVSAAKGASDGLGQHFSATSFCPGVTRGAFPGQSWLRPRGGQAEGTARAPQSSAGARVPRDAKTASGSRPSPRCPGGRAAGRTPGGLLGAGSGPGDHTGRSAVVQRTA